jgi:hypothetical protein
MFQVHFLQSNRLVSLVFRVLPLEVDADVEWLRENESVALYWQFLVQRNVA